LRSQGIKGIGSVRKLRKWEFLNFLTFSTFSSGVYSYLFFHGQPNLIGYCFF